MVDFVNFTLKSMNTGDLAEVISLWESTDGVGLGQGDSPENLVRYLARNPGLSQVAIDQQGSIIGAALCGHDGRRGYLNHVAVDSAWRRQGVATAIIERCFELLNGQGIDRCTVLVFTDNQEGQQFWARQGWRERGDLAVMQKDVRTG